MPWPPGPCKKAVCESKFHLTYNSIFAILGATMRKRLKAETRNQKSAVRREEADGSWEMADGTRSD
jgi:hypothetical protein